VEDGPTDEQANKRRKLLQQALELDKDDEEDGGNDAETNAEKVDGDAG